MHGDRGKKDFGNFGERLHVQSYPEQAWRSLAEKSAASLLRPGTAGVEAAPKAGP